MEIRGVAYRVVGVFQDVGGEAELRKVYVPITTAQLVYGQPNLVHAMAFTIGDADVAESQAMEKDARRLLSERLDVAPNDLLALRTQNNLEKFAKLTAVFGWINGFVWFVGVGTMLAGMISVSNIMLISVAERTREIGIRKAIGATPGSLVRMVLFEAILITAVSGYSGLARRRRLGRAHRPAHGQHPLSQESRSQRENGADRDGAHRRCRRARRLRPCPARRARESDRRAAGLDAGRTTLTTTAARPSAGGGIARTRRVKGDLRVSAALVARVH